jgi:hypothetical protein
MSSVGRRTLPSNPPDGEESGSREPRDPIRCPHCGSVDVELEAAFGGSLMSRQFYCRGCRTVFEWVKWEPDDPSAWLP